jgi:trans-aconitate 2-methyltransferase
MKTKRHGGAGPPWDPDQYRRFSEERRRPFEDLLARAVPERAVTRVLDLGCGDGQNTIALARRWPGAEVVGLDRSEEMLARARAAAGADAGGSGAASVRFVRADLREALGDDVTAAAGLRGVDLVLSNATLHWIPDHLALIERSASSLQPGACLAFQVPANFDEPSHVALRETAALPAFAARNGDAEEERPASHPIETYARLLLSRCRRVEAWETTYLHLLRGERPVLEWLKGTALRPILARLGGDREASFLDELGARLEAAYPAAPDGSVLYPFRRRFAVGWR